MTSAGFAIEMGHGPSPTATTTAPAPSYNISSMHPVSTSAAASRSSSSINSGSSNTNKNKKNTGNCPPPNTAPAPGNTNPNNTNANTPSLGHENSTFHAHRQNHNSSKLPAFRFADLKKDALVLPSLLQRMPPSPVSPNPAQNLNTVPDNQENPQDANHLHPTNQHQHQSQQHPSHPNNAQTIADKPVPLERPPSSATRISHQPKSQILRTSTIPTPSATTSFNPSPGIKRPASFPDSPRIVRTSTVASQSASTSAATQVAKRRLTTSGPADRVESSTSTEPALKSSRATETSDPAEDSTKEWAQGQRQLLPRTVDSAKLDEKKKSRPPISYRSPIVTNSAGVGGRPVIPPIRSFRSSGERKSLVLDMHTRRMSDESFSEDKITDPNQRDRTLRTLEGREDDYSRVTPPDSTDAATDNENTAEIFMNIAREESSYRQVEDRGGREDQSAISRITRASHRRPLSTTVATFQGASPPQLTRRLSDQRDNFRSRNLSDVQSAQKTTRELAYARPSITTSEAPARTSSLRTPLRPSPITPRHNGFQDDSTDGNPMYARRKSVAESTVSNSASRVSQYRNANLAVGQGRTYHSSPLVPKSVEFQKHEQQHGTDANHGVEGTESSGSTAAPSTVWDELDDLKSRIHRLELTGKIPPTSGAAMSRASDDRPPTATTNATTMSASPKRGSGTGMAPVDTTSTASSQRDSQPILLSALSKTKNLVSAEVFSAIESAATDALALSNMMGAAGLPGPISSGASTVGTGNVTDRQLRRKADSICRSLTELCIALADEVGPPKQPQTLQSQPSREADVLKSPGPQPTNSSGQKRTVAFPDSGTSKLLTTSPRAPTSLEQRRMSMLATSNLSSLTSPRYAAAPLTPLESTGAGRKTSMLLRTFRAGTEEPEELPGRRSSLILRKRRAVTEEPEELAQEGRKTSLLRTRRTMNDDDDDAGRFRTPSRAVTEVNGFRTAPAHISTLGQTSPPDTSLESSPLPRSRLVPSSFNSRLAGAPTSTSSGLMQRRFLGRTTVTQDRETGPSAVEKLAEDRGQRQFSLGQTSLLNRTGSITTPRRRESAIPGLHNTQQAAGGSSYHR
ncbi:hypothetical protein QBC37DRAFT_369532 [Rhypophila decipiens]|uniref:Uncharacterized protein n=1 Tax=Rhypophila decipiens TaxID=261697 RepID=A0AAN6YJT9_9PEZI|nr:hypothetical protein QBC37DRAFT_369532 [Rhypophila decipiens]